MCDQVDILPSEPPARDDHPRCAVCFGRVRDGACARCGPVVHSWAPVRDPGFLAAQCVLAGLALCMGMSVAGFWLIFDTPRLLQPTDSVAYDRAWRVLLLQSGALVFWASRLRAFVRARPRVVLRAGVSLVGLSLLASLLVWNWLGALL